MPNNRDTILLETVKTHRARLLSAFLYGELAERRLGQDNLKRLLGSVVLAAVICTGCVGFALVTSLIATQAARQAQQRSSGGSTPGISDQPYAADADRNRRVGWGVAEVGGRWTTTGSSSDYRVRGGSGVINVPPGNSGSAFLNKSRETADLSATVEINGPGSSVVVLGRKVEADDYRAIAKLTSGRNVSVSLASRQAGETVLLSNTVRLLGSYRAGEEIKIRMQVFGVNPTLIRTKVWRGSEVEPQAWSVTAQDGFDRLQRSGVVGVGRHVPARRSIPSGCQCWIS